MKVAIVYNFFPHYRQAVMRRLSQSPHHEYIFVADDRNIEPSIKSTDLDDCTFLKARCWRFGPLVFQQGLLSLALRPDIDTIVYLGNPYYVMTWASAMLSRLCGKRVLFWTHGWTRADGGLKGSVRRLFYRVADGLLLYGHFAKSLGIAYGYPPESLHVVYNSLDYPRQRLARLRIEESELMGVRKQLFDNPERPLLVCSARLRRECEFELLIKAQAQLDRQGLKTNLLLIGDGPERRHLEKLASELGVSVKFFGACYDEQQLARLTMASNVTVSPGKIGLTAIQSLAFGTPVITHNTFHAQGPEWEAIIPGRTGDFFERGDVDELSRVIRRWTTSSLPDAARRRTCYELVERFYNPEFQCRVIDRAVSGAAADDIFWLKNLEADAPRCLITRCIEAERDLINAI